MRSYLKKHLWKADVVYVLLYFWFCLYIEKNQHALLKLCKRKARVLFRIYFGYRIKKKRVATFCIVEIELHKNLSRMIARYVFKNNISFVYIGSYKTRNLKACYLI